MKAPLIAFAAVFGATLAAQPALAESVTVQYKDLDLSTQAGQKELDRRIDGAAKQLCSADEPLVGSRIPAKEVRDCIADARKKLEKRVATLTDKKVAGS
jgi:UrcA family protein